MVEIRQARQDDAPAIAELTNRLIRETTVTFRAVPTTAEIQARAIGDRGPAFLVAAEDGIVLGYATFFPFRNPDGYQHSAEHTIMLGEAARGQGIGPRLLAELCARARGAGIHALFAGVSAENEAGIRFHAAQGFREVGRLPEAGRKFDRWLTLVLMQKILG
jgi:phosphinothricin acetyltransferase